MVDVVVNTLQKIDHWHIIFCQNLTTHKNDNI